MAQISDIKAVFVHGQDLLQALLVVLCKGCIKAFTFPWWDKIVALEAACMAEGISAA